MDSEIPKTRASCRRETPAWTLEASFSARVRSLSRGQRLASFVSAMRRSAGSVEGELKSSSFETGDPVPIDGNGDRDDPERFVARDLPTFCDGEGIHPKLPPEINKSGTFGVHFQTKHG